MTMHQTLIFLLIWKYWHIFQMTLSPAIITLNYAANHLNEHDGNFPTSLPNHGEHVYFLFFLFVFLNDSLLL